MRSRGIIKLQSFRGREEEKNTHKCAGLCFSWTFKIIFLSCPEISHRSKWYHIWEKSWMDGNGLWGEGEKKGSRHILLRVPFSEPEHPNERVGEKSSVWVQSKASGGLWVQPKASGGLSIAVWWVRGADLAALQSLRAHALQEASFVPGAPVKWFSTHFSRLKMKKKKLRD